jgi:hypothetical protein
MRWRGWRTSLDGSTVQTDIQASVRRKRQKKEAADIKAGRTRHPEDRLVLKAMPGTASALAAVTRIDVSRIGGSVARLSRAGLARKNGKVWQRT